MKRNGLQYIKITLRDQPSRRFGDEKECQPYGNSDDCHMNTQPTPVLGEVSQQIDSHERRGRTQKI